MKISKKKTLIKLCSLTCIIAIITGAANTIHKIKDNSIKTTYSDSDKTKEEYENEFELIEDGNEIIKLDNIVGYKWYILKVKYDDENTDIIMTRKTTIEKYNDGSIDYYFTDVFKGDYKVYRVNYNYYNETYTIINGPEILEAVPIEELLDEQDIKKDSFSKQELYNLLQDFKEKNIKKKLSGKSYTLNNGKIKH